MTAQGNQWGWGVRREDEEALVAIELSDVARAGMGLGEVSDGTAPELLVDVYLRRSGEKEDLATLRGHLADIARWVQLNGLLIRRVWFEQLSASKAYVRRREFELATQAVLDGKSRTLAVWKTDRFDRRGMGVVGAVLDKFETRGARLVSVTEGLDSSQSARLVFAVLSERARDEVRDIALRVKRGHDAHKQEGRRGTGRPPFGLASPPGSGRVEPHEAEYPTARRLADLLLEGLTTTRTAWALNEEGHRTRGGFTWSATAVSKLAQSPLFAGMVPQRRRKTDADGNPLGQWEGYGEPLLGPDGAPIMCGTGVVSVDEWYKVKSLIGGRTHPGTSRGGLASSRLLTGSGLFICGRCGGPMSYRGGRYGCEWRKQRGTSVCLGITALSGRVDRAVGEAWAGHVSGLPLGDPVLVAVVRQWLELSDPATRAKRQHVKEALEAAQSRVRQLEEDYYVWGKLTKDRYEELSCAQVEAIQEMEGRALALEQALDPATVRNGSELVRIWNAPETTTTAKRSLLRSVVKQIAILPAVRRGDPTPITQRLEYVWVSAAVG